MTALPRIMVAPNGARHSKADHPMLPITMAENLDTAQACFHAGATGVHLHLRDETGGHLLDAGLYRETVQELHHRVPAMLAQITTEAVGIYAPDHQIAVALNSGAALVSVATRELAAGLDNKQISHFYQDAHARGIHVQHILYDLRDLLTLKSILPARLYTDPALHLLFVLGKYGDIDSAAPDLLDAYLDQMKQDQITPDWAVCAFGIHETACVLNAARKGGKIRAGFENSFWHSDGQLATDNADRIRAICAELP